MKTRSAPTSAEEKTSTTSTASEPKSRPTPSTNPPKFCILPKGSSQEARFVTLSNPRDSKPERYFFDPAQGLYEFTRIAPPGSTLLTNLPKKISQDRGDEKTKDDNANGYIFKKTELLVATPVDLIFQLLTILAPAPTSQRDEAPQRLFQPLDDLLDNRDDIPAHLRYILDHDTFKPEVEKRMTAICDTVDAGGESMFRLSEEKLLHEMIRKAERMIEVGLPASVEERFVLKELEAPMMSIKREDSSITSAPSQTTESSQEPSLVQSDTQDSVSTTAPSVASSFMEESSAATTPAASESGIPENLLHLQRLRTALSFLQSSYLPDHLDKLITAKLTTPILSSSSPSTQIDFDPLTAHLKHLASLRTAAISSRSIGHFSRKRGADDDGMDFESRAEAKRRKEEEEKKKKANESRGIRDLKKVNTTGMKKMSDFFKKK